MKPLLEVTNLRAYYGRIEALHGVSFAVNEGRITALLGANGAGKSTTLRALSGMIRTTGEIAFSGTQVQGLKTEAIARLRIAHIPEGRGTFNRLTVEENLRLGAITRADSAAINADVAQVFDYFPRLNERKSQQAGTLSGGEQQMLAIGRALMLRPRLMLLDEPSFGLAPLIIQELFGILARINKEQSVSMLIVEQNADLVLSFASDAYLLETGNIVMSGPAHEIRENADVRRSYLGQ